MTHLIFPVFLLSCYRSISFFYCRCIVDYLTYPESFSCIGWEFVEKNANMFHALLQQWNGKNKCWLVHLNVHDVFQNKQQIQNRREILSKMRYIFSVQKPVSAFKILSDMCKTTSGPLKLFLCEDSLNNASSDAHFLGDSEYQLYFYFRTVFY
jgi:hypothetical protein